MTFQKVHNNTSSLQVQKAEIIISVEEKIANFGQSIRSEHDSFNTIHMAVTFDTLIEDLKQGLEKLGEVNIDRFVA